MGFVMPSFPRSYALCCHGPAPQVCHYEYKYSRCAGTGGKAPGPSPLQAPALGPSAACTGSQLSLPPPPHAPAALWSLDLALVPGLDWKLTLVHRLETDPVAPADWIAPAW